MVLVICILYTAYKVGDHHNGFSCVYTLRMHVVLLCAWMMGLYWSLGDLESQSLVEPVPYPELFLIRARFDECTAYSQVWNIGPAALDVGGMETADNQNLVIV